MQEYLNLAIFFDGTWNDNRSETNVWKLREDLRLGAYSFEGEPERYVTEALYEPGPGTSAGMKLYGGAFAGDFGKAVQEAYAWTCERVLNLADGNTGREPQLFIFGFSRGAYRAHVLGWLLSETGIPRDFAKCRDVAAEYIEHRETAGLLRDGTIDPPRIKMMGLWDAVTAPLDKYSGYHDGMRPPLSENLYHALAANERRLNFPAMQYDPKTAGTVQTWFSGAHGDVGGGYPAGERELSDVALSWMKHHAMECGLDFLTEPAECAPVDFGKLRKIHDEAPRSAKPRRVFREGELVHASLEARRTRQPSYAPDVLAFPARATAAMLDETAYPLKA